MRENVGARMLLFVAYLAAALGYGSWVASRTAFDTDATKQAATTLLAQPAVQRSLTDDLTEQVDKELANAQADPDVRKAVGAALQDPRLIAAFSDAIGQFHASLMGERNADGKVSIDTRVLVAAVRDGLAKYDPKLAAEFANNAKEQPLTVEIGGKDVPKLGDTRDRAHTVMLLGFIAALVLATLSMLMLHDRKHFRRLGKRVAYLSAVPLLGFVLAPWLLAKFDGDGPQIAGAVMRTYADRVVPSALVLLIVGATIVVATILWPKPKLVMADPVPTLPNRSLPNPMQPSIPPALPTENAINEKLYM